MTREEAIKTIQGLYNQQGIDALTKDEMTALGMAIWALQAQADIEEILKDFSDELRADAERQTLNTISGVNIAITRMNRILHKFPTVAQADGDLISRQDAIDAMTLSNINQNMDDLNDGDGRRVRRSVQRILAQLPTVAIPQTDCNTCDKAVRDRVGVIGCAKFDSKPTVAIPSATGHWIGIDEEPHEDYECDACGYVVSTWTANIEPHEEYKFCPNCGAKMD